MWMMGYNDGAEFNMADSFNGRRLRHLLPRPSAATSSNNSASINPPYLSRINGTDLLALNHHLAVVPEQSKKEFNTQQVVVSSRWNPTPEQLQALEELYRRGTRTPSADQIQHITAQLRRYGKIEGKNVFYWFQNHKARERQKRRRQLESSSDDQHVRDMENTERKETGSNRTGFEVEQTKSWAPSTNCSTLAENTVSIQRAAKSAASECRADGWVQFEEGDLQHRRSLVERNATWQMMQLSCSPIHPITSAATTTSTNAVPVTAATMDPKIIKTKDLSIFIAPHNEDLINHYASVGDDSADEAGCEEESRTLQLFPLQARNDNDNENFAEKEEMTASAMNSSYTPNYQFFEFLPLKN